MERLHISIFLAVLIFSQIIDGKTFLIKREKTYENFKNNYVNSTMRGKRGDSKPPVISWKKIKAEDSGNFARIHTSSNSSTFVIHCFNNDSLIKDWSTVYVTRDLGKSLEKTSLSVDGKESIIDSVSVHKDVIVLVDKKENCYFVSRNGGQTFKTFKTNESHITSVHFHENLVKYIALVTNNSMVYVSNDMGENFELHDYGVEHFRWSPYSPYYYTTFKSITHEGLFSIYRADGNEPFSFEYALGNVISLHTSNDLVYAVINDTNKRLLYISFDDYEFLPALFPHYLDPTAYSVRHSTDNDIFVVLRNKTGQNFLYSALRFDLKFTRLAEVYSLQFSNNDYYVCNDVQLFPQLPGLLIGNIKTDYVGENIHPTMISFTHGVHWAHVNPPLTADVPECKWPSCYLSLQHSCYSYDRGLISVTNAPHLILAHGSVQNGDSQYTLNFYVSTDAGLSWHFARKGFHIFTVLDQGGVIVAYPEQTNVLYYSYDEGNQWEAIELGFSDFYAQAAYHDDSGVATSSVSFGYDPDDHTVAVVNSDFTEALGTVCKTSDYVEFTPGATSQNECFQGKKSSFMKRKHNVICISSGDIINSTNSVSCPCQDEDFGCLYGYYMDEGKCLSDPDFVKPSSDDCFTGEFHVTDSKRGTLLGDLCLNTGQPEDVTKICGLDEETDSIVIRIKNTYRLLPLKDKKPTTLYFMPITENNNENVGSFAVDLTSNCLFYVTDGKIKNTCWGSRSQAELIHSSVFIYDKDVHSVQFDNNARNLYFRDSFGINVMSVDKRYRRLIYQSEETVNYFKIFPPLGILMCSTIKFGETREKVQILNMAGLNVKNFYVDESVISSSVGNCAYCLDIYTVSTIYTYSVKTGQLTSKLHHIDNLVDVEARDGNTYILTKTGLKYNDFSLQSSDFNEIHLFDSSDYKKNPCSKAHCGYLCVPTVEDSYECLCPNDMYTVNNTDCKCDEQHPDCLKCGDQQFQCENGKCVNVHARCNGVLDCSDGSDEKDCTYRCNEDEFMCADNSKCIGVELICDGVSNCQDGSDEKGCKDINPCSNNEFKCSNSICIPLNKVCDGQNNCGDYSDEENCLNEQCKSFEFRCNSGGCILLNKRCDGKYDCPDLSDEMNCGFSNRTTSADCALKCGDKCIPKSKICDRVTDCDDKRDELNCGYVMECPVTEDLICSNEVLCYKTNDVCDGFEHCLGGSDEVNCEKNVLCKHPFNFQCKTSNQCILSNEYCNGVNDCQDNSDEVDCSDEPRITSVHAPSITFDSAQISWDVSKRLSSPIYDIMLQPWKHDHTKAVNATTKEQTYKFYELAPCESYIAYVKLRGSDVGIKKDFITYNINPEAPNNVAYNSKKKILTWSYSDYTCRPTTFYVSCFSDSDVVYREFSTAKELKLKINKGAMCSVAACASNVFNLTCSDYSSRVAIPRSGNKTNQAVAVIITLLILISLGVAGYFLYKRYKGRAIQFPSNLRAVFGNVSRRTRYSAPDQARFLSSESEEDAQIDI